MNTPYHPIACALHDELQLRVLRGREVEVRWNDPAGGEVVRRGRPVDVFSRGGSEYLRLDDGREIRLDHLVAVDGLAFGNDRC